MYSVKKKAWLYMNLIILTILDADLYLLLSILITSFHFSLSIQSVSTSVTMHSPMRNQTADTKAVKSSLR